MSRKPKKGYFVKGQFVAEGSELDIELKLAMKWGQSNSRTDLKRESEQLQFTGEQLLDLRSDLLKPLPLPDNLADALAAAKRITNFEGRRRQMQFIGKLMRRLDEATLAQITQALELQRLGLSHDSAQLHEAEQWRLQMLADDSAIQDWMALHPQTDSQQLRALVRQVRKDANAVPAATTAAPNAAHTAPADTATDAAQQPPEPASSPAPKQGRAYRDLFQLLKSQLAAQRNAAEAANTHTEPAAT